MSQKPLLNTRDSRTLTSREQKTVDPSAKKLVDEYQKLRRQRLHIDDRMRAIQTALTIMDVRIDDGAGFLDAVEAKYADTRPFREMTLADSCLKVLQDHDGFGMDKNKVEFLLTLGGYPFDAKDAVNSVEITLRTLASDGKCEV